MKKQWGDLGIKKQDSYLLVGLMAVELSSSNDPIESHHGDIWMDQMMGCFDFVKTI